MIRSAVAGDIPAMTKMGARFFEASGFEKWFRFSPRSFADTLGRLMVDERAVVLVAEQGMAAAMAYPCWFDREHLTAQELFWWVEPDARGGDLGKRLRQGLEDWAYSKGCSTMEMGALEASKVETLVRYYERHGYGAKERIFCKGL